jgi:hypothetical protein
MEQDGTRSAAPALIHVRLPYAGTWLTPEGGAKYFRWKNNDTFTKPMSTGTSTRGPMTAANAAPCPMPNTATATTETVTAQSPLRLAFGGGFGAPAQGRQRA